MPRKITRRQAGHRHARGAATAREVLACCRRMSKPVRNRRTTLDRTAVDGPPTRAEQLASVVTKRYGLSSVHADGRLAALTGVGETRRIRGYVVFTQSRLAARGGGSVRSLTQRSNHSRQAYTPNHVFEHVVGRDLSIDVTSRRVRPAGRGRWLHALCDRNRCTAAGCGRAG
jgi:hypothetical protein